MPILEVHRIEDKKRGKAIKALPLLWIGLKEIR